MESRLRPDAVINIEIAMICTLTRDPERRMVNGGEISRYRGRVEAGSASQRKSKWTQAYAYLQVASG
jgi:hypothetical protein